LITIIYSKHDDSDAKTLAVSLRSVKDHAFLRNGQFWQGEIEKCDKCLCTEPYKHIADAYKAKGIVTDIIGGTKQVTVEKVVEKVDETATEAIESLASVSEAATEPLAVPKRGRPSRGH